MARIKRYEASSENEMGKTRSISKNVSTFPKRVLPVETLSLLSMTTCSSFIASAWREFIHWKSLGLRVWLWSRMSRWMQIYTTSLLKEHGTLGKKWGGNIQKVWEERYRMSCIGEASFSCPSISSITTRIDGQKFDTMSEKDQYRVPQRWINDLAFVCRYTEKIYLVYGNISISTKLRHRNTCRYSLLSISWQQHRWGSTWTSLLLAKSAVHLPYLEFD